MKAPSKFVIANLKMNLSSNVELEHWLNSFLKAKKDLELYKTKLVLCPQAIYLEKFFKKIKSESLDLGAQNCSWVEKGAFTGELSSIAMHQLGANYVILGHSERRDYLGETDLMVNAKIKTALKNRLKPILCVGEDAKQKKQDYTMEVILNQLKNCLADISRGRIEEIIICYEPVWAISANNPDHLPNSNEIMGAKLLIKKFLVGQYGKNITDKIKIIYGGSVDVSNLKEVCIDPAMDGVLVGGASLRPYDLIKIAQMVDEG